MPPLRKIRWKFVPLVLMGCIVSLSGQTQWEKYPTPVLEPGLAGSWDENVAVANTVLWHQNIYKMWYEGDGGFGYSTSSDGLVWTKDTTHNPIFQPGQAGSWDEMAVNHASVLIHNGIYHMWYSGVDADDDNRIGHATSPDGIFWTRDTANPVLNLGTTPPWDTEEAIHPSVIYEDNTFKMFYNGYGSNTQRILYAFSSDGTSWTGYTSHPMLEPGSSGSWDDWELGPMSVLKIGADYHMWYAGWDDTVNVTYQIGHATSTDGLFWTRDTANPVLRPGVPGEWDDKGVVTSSVIQIEDTLKMWYGGYNDAKFRTGYAFSLLPPTGLKEIPSHTIPSDYELSQNYPNPFNPITHIEFNLSNAEFITLTISDLSGRKVATLVNERMPVGNHKLIWDAKSFPSGIYFCQLKIDNFIQTVKMVLLR